MVSVADPASRRDGGQHEEEVGGRAHVPRDGRETTFHVVVIHLKAFHDSVDRRREACQIIAQFVQAQPVPQRYVFIGDFNDDPHDPPADNSFTGTLLGTEPSFRFATAALPPG